MPLYEYTDETGQTVNRCVPVDERDKQRGLKRHAIPTRVRTICGSSSESQVLAATTLKGYHAEECKHGSRFKSSFTPEQIKRAWAE